MTVEDPYCHRDCFDPEFELTLCNEDGQFCYITVIPQSLVFTPSNRSVPQTVYVASLDDHLDKSDINEVTIEHSSQIQDSLYHHVDIPVVAKLVSDNDEPEVMISTDSLFVVERGFGDTYDIVLNSEPWADVTLAIEVEQECHRKCSGGSPNPWTCDTEMLLCNTTANPKSVVFSPRNWAAPQEIFIEAVNDEYQEWDQQGFHFSRIEHSGRLP